MSAQIGAEKVCLSVIPGGGGVWYLTHVRVARSFSRAARAEAVLCHKGEIKRLHKNIFLYTLGLKNRQFTHCHKESIYW